MNTAATDDSVARLDKWLWAVRIFKTRALATEACRTGHVKINELPAKPGRTVRADELVVVRQGIVMRTLRVIGVPRSRVGAKLVAEFCTDLTPAAEWEKAKEHRVQQLLELDRSGGRPTKRDRRLRDRLFE